MKYPKTRIDPVEENIHGHKLVDNYRWLEDSDSSEVLAWSKDQNTLTVTTLSKHSRINELKHRLSDLFNYDSFGVPREYGGYYFWAERKAGKNQFAVYRKKGLNGKPELLLDPNGLRKDDTTTISTWNASPEGRYFVYALSEGGTEMNTVYVRDLKTSEELKVDTIPYSRQPNICWLKDESGFFYVRNPEPGTVPKGEEHLHCKVYQHKIGRIYTRDPMVFGKDRHKEDFFDLKMSDDGSVLIIEAGRDWLQNEVWVRDVKTGETNNIIKGLAAQFHMQIVRSTAYLWTDYQAGFGRVIKTGSTKLPANIEQWESFIKERNYPLLELFFTKDLELAIYQKDICSIVEVLDKDGQKLHNLELPPYSTLSWYSSKYSKSEFFYSYTNFLTPLEVCRYNPESESVESYQRLETPINPADYIVKQQWYDSKDGTSVPMFIIHHKKVQLNGSNPTLLYGYGGFNVSLTPSFPRGTLPFIESGGVYAVANIRGGDEFGSGWHKSGILEQKQNTFDDFIAAGEYLIDQKYTKSDKLAIMGGSNGGLLVGACAVQRPDLFKAVVCRVPLLDMVRFPKFLIAGRWISEYGDPEVKKEFDYIIKYSPYHNVHPGVEYPATLFMTADHDTRVEPLHARKMTALLQATNQTNPILVRTEVEAGHGAAGTPLDKWIDGQANALAFVDWQLSN